MLDYGPRNAAIARGLMQLRDALLAQTSVDPAFIHAASRALQNRANEPLLVGKQCAAHGCMTIVTVAIDSPAVCEHCKDRR